MDSNDLENAFDEAEMEEGRIDAQISRSTMRAIVLRVTKEVPETMTIGEFRNMLGDLRF